MSIEAIKTLIQDLRLNHEYCPKEVILQAADELERLLKIEQAQKQQALDKKAENAKELGLDYEPIKAAYGIKENK